jgi:hypothetical protein
MMVDALVAWPPVSSTLNDGSLLHMPMGGAGRSYIPIVMGAANCADAEVVMYSGGDGALLPMLRTGAKHTHSKNQRGAVVSRTNKWQKGRLRSELQQSQICFPECGCRSQKRARGKGAPLRRASTLGKAAERRLTTYATNDGLNDGVAHSRKTLSST